MNKLYMRLAAWFYNRIPKHVQEQFKIGGLDIKVLSEDQWTAHKGTLAKEAYERKRTWILENLDEKALKKNGIKINEDSINIDTAVCSFDVVQKINNA